MQNAAPRPPPPDVLAPEAAVVVCASIAPAPESVVVTGADGWVTVVGVAVAVETAAGAGIVSWLVVAAPVVALDEDPLDEVAPGVVPPLAGVAEPVGTVNGGLPLVSAVAPPPPPHEATPNAIVTPTSTATP